MRMRGREQLHTDTGRHIFAYLRNQVVSPVPPND